MEWELDGRCMLAGRSEATLAMTENEECDAPNPGGPLTTHQPAETCVSCHETHT